MATTTTGKIDIEVESRTDAAVANFDKLKKAEADAKAGLVALDKQFETTGRAALGGTGKIVAGYEKAKVAAKQLAPSIVGVGVAAAQGNVNLGNMAAAALASANAFGPWGVAIGVAGTALYTLASAQDEAAKAAERHRFQLARQRQEAESLANFARDEKAKAERASALEKGVLETGGLSAMREALQFLEEDIVVAEARGEKVSKQLTQQATIRADMLRLEAHAAETMGRMDERRKLIAEADQVMRADRLRMLREENTAEESITKSKSEQLRLSGEQLALEGRGARGIDRGMAASVDEQIIMGGRSADESTASRNGTELIDPFSRENELELIAQKEAERIANLEAMKESAAEAAAKRHEDEIARQEAVTASYQGVGEAVGGALGDVAAMSLAAALAGEKGFKKTLAAWGKMESIKLAAIGLSEGVQAVVSAAFWNIPQAIQHAEAAAQAFATAGIIAGMTGALGGFGGGGKAANSKNPGGTGFNTGASFGGGAGDGPAANGPSSTNSQKDQLPTAGEMNVQQSGSANMGSGRGGTVIQYNFAAGSLQTLGAIDEKTGLVLQQGIDKARRGLGSTG